MNSLHRVSLVSRDLTKASKRNKSYNVRLLNVISDNCDFNIQSLIERAKAVAALGAVNWDDPTWNIDEFQRSHKQRQSNLHFTSHRHETARGRNTGCPFDNERNFSDVVKAVIRMRAEIGGQCVANQREMILAFRYLYEELKNHSFDVRLLEHRHFEMAARAVRASETEVSAYKRIQKLEEIARTLDECRLVRVKLDWVCRSNRRPTALRDLLEDQIESGKDSEVSVVSQHNKLPTEGVIEGIAHLYHVIPKDAWADRIRICFISLLLITGFRIGELLTLRASKVETEEPTGRRYIVFYPEKGAPPAKKWFMTSAGELAAKLIDEILELTEKSRSTALWLHENPGHVRIEGLDLICATTSIIELGQALNLKQVRLYLKSREIQVFGKGKKAFVQTADLVKSMRSESYSKPVNVVLHTGELLYLKDALACVPLNAFRSSHATLDYAIRPISEQQLTDFIGTRLGSGNVFERYGIKGPDGNVLAVASHAFRHWLNDLLDRGGLSDLEQATYFGRKNVGDNRAYQSMTHRERVRRVREDLLGGKMRGPVAEVLNQIPIDRKKVFLEARVQAMHLVAGGACFHEFSQTPCPNHMACTDGCGDFHWSTDDAVQKKELEFEKQVLQVAVETARLEVKEDSYGAESWLQHNLRKLQQVRFSLGETVDATGGVPI